MAIKCLMTLKLYVYLVKQVKETLIFWMEPISQFCVFHNSFCPHWQKGFTFSLLVFKLANTLIFHWVIYFGIKVKRTYSDPTPNIIASEVMFLYGTSWTNNSQSITANAQMSTFSEQGSFFNISGAILELAR